MFLAIFTLVVAGLSFAGGFMELMATMIQSPGGVPTSMIIGSLGVLSAVLWFGAAIAIARGKGLTHWSVRLASLYSLAFTIGASAGPWRVMGGVYILVGVGYPLVLLGMSKWRPLQRRVPV